MTDLGTSFPSLVFDRPEDGILVITMQAEGRLNAADASMHRDLAEVWRAGWRTADLAETGCKILGTKAMADKVAEQILRPAETKSPHETCVAVG